MPPVTAPREGGSGPHEGSSHAGHPSGRAALAERRLERSVAAALRVIAAAHVERQAPPVSAARRRLSEVYGATRLAGA